MNKFVKFAAGLAVVATPLVTTIACSKDDKKEETMINSIAYGYLKEIVNQKLSNFTGSTDQAKMREFIITKMKAIGIAKENIVEKPFTYDIPKNNTSKKFYNSLMANDDFKKDQAAKYKEFKESKNTGAAGIQGIKGKNIEITIPGIGNAVEKAQIIGIGAHYDLHPDHYAFKDKAWSAVNDNRSGFSEAMAIASFLAKNPAKKTVKIFFWDAEEIGLFGSKKYLEIPETLKGVKDNWKLYINLDSVAGGDYLYMGHGFDDKKETGSSGRNNSTYYFNKAMKMAHINNVNVRTSWVQGDNINWDYTKLNAIFVIDANNDGKFDETSTAQKIKISDFLNFKEALKITDDSKKGIIEIGEKKAKIVKSDFDQIETSLRSLGISIENLKQNLPYKKGAMYPASDHVPFNRIGLEVLGFEGTNYDVYGHYGQDGYSQTAHKDFWYPYTLAEWKAAGKKEADYTITEAQKKVGIKGGVYKVDYVNKNGYDRKFEKGYGKIWHTQKDRFDLLEKTFPGRLNQQLESIYTIVTKTLADNE